MEVTKGDGSRLRAKVEAMGRQECQQNRARLLSPRERGRFGKVDQERQRRRPNGNRRPNQCCLQKHLHMRNYYSMIIIRLNDGMFFNKDFKKSLFSNYTIL